MGIPIPAIFRGDAWLPCCVLNRNPFICCAYDTDFTRNLPLFAASLPQDRPVHMLLQLGWQHETAETVEPFAAELRQAMTLMPQLRCLVLANTMTERDRIRNSGIKAEFCHQNAFLDENRYPLNPDARKRFDAIYVARITPFKRHLLAREIASLYLIGTHSLREEAYYQEVRAALPLATYRVKAPSWRIGAEISTARCGLCLSQEEGAMFVSAEYLLSGVPVVNTANIGGRDVLMPDFAVATVADDPTAVRDAVARWAAQAPDPRAVRAAFLEKAAPHRAKLHEILGAIAPGGEPIALPHKLGIRCRRWPWQRLTSGVRKHVL